MKIGYAMYSARDLIKDAESMKKVLGELAEMGYDGVEFFLYYGIEAEKLKAMADEVGLEVIGTHVHKPRWDADTAGEIDYAVNAQIPYLVYPYVEPGLRNEEFYRNLPGQLKELAKDCKENGIQLQYHNHDFEFKMLSDNAFDGITVMEHLMEADDSYTFELDTFWAQYAGIDVPSFMKKMGDRIRMIHIKDSKGTNANGFPCICAIGTGTVNNTEIIQCAKEMEKEWLIVELDDTPLTPMESARISINEVKKILA